MAIYFIQCGKNGPIKIGQTDGDVKDRMAQLQTACPYELRLMWIYEGNVWTEAEIHEELKHEHVRGEWFHPGKDVLEFIGSELPNCHDLRFINNGNYVVTVSEFQGEILIASDLGDISLRPSDKRIVVFGYKNTNIEIG